MTVLYASRYQLKCVCACACVVRGGLSKFRWCSGGKGFVVLIIHSFPVNKTFEGTTNYSGYLTSCSADGGLNSVSCYLAEHVGAGGSGGGGGT